MATGDTDSSPSRQLRGPLPAIDLGVAPYAPVQDLQARLRAAVIEGALPGVLLLLEHEPVITLGGRGADSDLRSPALTLERGIEVISSERGGQATLHAPGQLVSYPVVPIPHRDLGVYVRGLEQVLLLLLDKLGVAAYRRPGHPGLYVDGDKIASIGLRCQRWVASHGTSLNVNVDLSLFGLIVSCGEPLLRQTSLQALTARSYEMAEIKALYLRCAQETLGWEFLPIRAVAHDLVEATLGLD
jgi:lipoyl(octanoyl) transferase